MYINFHGENKKKLTIIESVIVRTPGLDLSKLGAPEGWLDPDPELPPRPQLSDHEVPDGPLDTVQRHLWSDFGIIVSCNMKKPEWDNDFDIVNFFVRPINIRVKITTN